MYFTSSDQILLHQYHHLSHLFFIHSKLKAHFFHESFGDCLLMDCDFEWTCLPYFVLVSSVTVLIQATRLLSSAR